MIGGSGVKRDSSLSGGELYTDYSTGRRANKERFLGVESLVNHEGNGNSVSQKLFNLKFGLFSLDFTKIKSKCETSISYITKLGNFVI